MPTEDVFPTLFACTRLAEAHDGFTLFDVKFYPFALPNNDPIFAVTGERTVFICRARLNAEQNKPPFDILKCWKDEDPDASYNSLVWTKHPTGRPLLCIAGSSPKQIKILDFLHDDTDETIVRTLPGHGKGINDLAVHPHSTNLIASASEDYTIRLWDLRPKFENQPCVAMFCGEGHKQPTLAMSFHPNGRWLLSGGLDTAVCLWAVPGLDELDRPAEELKEHHKPKEVYYPHFFSTEVHHNYVDCLQFYGDLILSRAAKDQNSRSSDNEIILWRIEGYDPDDPPPVRPPIPVPDVYTRSSFSHSPETRGFQRLLSFSIPHTDRFYHRFGLLVGQGMRPILSMGNQQSTFLFWDLRRLQEGWDPAEEKKKKGGGTRGRKPKSGVSSENLNRLNDLRSGSVASDGTGGTTPMPSSTSVSAQLERKYALSDPFTPLKAHTTIYPKTKVSRDANNRDTHFATSQMAWSPDGTWLVACGDRGMICVFHRDKSVVNGVPAKNGDVVGGGLKS